MAATFVLWGERDRLLALKAVQRAPLGQQVRISKKTRTVDQNALLHSLLTQIADQLPWPKEWGELHDLEWWKRTTTLSWLHEINAHPEVITTLDGSAIGLLIPHTSDLDTEQCASLSEWLFAFGTTNGVVFKEPDRGIGPEPPPREYDQ